MAPLIHAALLQAIQEKVMATIQGALARPQHTDAQFSVGGGVLLQVTGAMRVKVCAAESLIPDPQPSSP